MATGLLQCSDALFPGLPGLFKSKDPGAQSTSLAAASAHLSEREIVELIIVAGFYIMLARLTETLGVDIDPPLGSALVRSIEQRVGAASTATRG